MSILCRIISQTSGEVNYKSESGNLSNNAFLNSIGYVPQDFSLYAELSPYQNLRYFGTLYGIQKADLAERIDELLTVLGLYHVRHKKIHTFSGGMKRRVNLAIGIINNPSILFLDEPTTGLDPRGRQDMWGVIDELVKGGVTLLLTTQYLEEADHLADEIAVIDHGKVIARGTSDSLKKQVGGERLEIVVENEHLEIVKDIVARVSGSAINIDEGLRQVSAPVTTGSKALIEAAKMLDEKGIHPLDIGLKRPSLDDVFLALTGHVAEEKEEDEIYG